MTQIALKSEKKVSIYFNMKFEERIIDVLVSIIEPHLVFLLNAWEILHETLHAQQCRRYHQIIIQASHIVLTILNLLVGFNKNVCYVNIRYVISNSIFKKPALGERRRISKICVIQKIMNM